ncbi:MAG TPA: LacI family DNA-binding transcriptional regulator [Microvirga sp.]|nr:LacI family DNA-binding transcriptional regulator [Microvirga sp.]
MHVIGSRGSSNRAINPAMMKPHSAQFARCANCVRPIGCVPLSKLGSLDRRISQLDIARAAGVSVSTVSRALSDAPGLSLDLRKQIRKLAQELAYEGRGVRAEPALHATAYVTLNRATGGLAAFYEEIVGGLLEEARGASLEIDVRLVEETSLDVKRLQQDAARSGSPALFLVGIDPLPEVIQHLLTSGTPVVLVNGFDPAMRFDCVAPANFYGGAHAARLLIEAGHRSLLYLTGRPRWTTLQRLRGYSTVIAEAEGIRSIVCELPEGSRENAEATIHELLQAGKRAWTAVFCMNDLIAVGVMQALEAQGIRVPEDVSVLGFDDLPCAIMTSPRLTTLRVNRRELGREAVRLLLRRLAKPDAPLLQVEAGVVAVAGGTVASRET